MEKLVKLTKLKEIPNPKHPHNIAEGFERINYYVADPVIGQRFWVGEWSTSGVQEILSPNTFRTYNSIYKWEILEGI